MLPFPEGVLVERLLWLLSNAARFAVLAKIRSEGLASSFRLFSWYLVAECTLSLGLFFLPDLTAAYGWFWLAWQPVLWALYILIVVELHGLILARYPGIRTFLQRVMNWVLIGSVLVSLAWVMPDLASNPQRFPLLFYAVAVNKGVVAGLVISLVAATGLLVFYPIRLPRNIAAHAVLYFLYFLSEAVAFFVLNAQGYAGWEWVRLAQFGSQIACLTGWMLILDSAGEKKAAPVAVRNPGTEERLLRQLEGINEALIRMARK